jgi:hypothetical protein
MPFSLAIEDSFTILPKPLLTITEKSSVTRPASNDKCH